MFSWSIFNVMSQLHEVFHEIEYFRWIQKKSNFLFETAPLSTFLVGLFFNLRLKQNLQYNVEKNTTNNGLKHHMSVVLSILFVHVLFF
jgi:hypothetical protein